MGDSSEGIFRKAALDRLSSPEQLDQIAGLTSPIGWIALVALGALVASALAWSILGTVPSWVGGRGILVAQGGHLFDARAPADGYLVSLVPIGTSVHRGDVLVTLDGTRLKEELKHAEDVALEKQGARDALAAKYQREIALRQQNFDARRNNLRLLVEAAHKSAEFYTRMVGQQQNYVSKGVVTPLMLQEARQKLDQAQQHEREGNSELLHLDAETLELHARRDQELLAADETIHEARRHLDETRTRLEQGTRVLSPLDGRVTEVKASAGALVSAGKAVLSIETAGEGLEMLLYIPPEYGKKVTPGMEVLIEPATVKKEEYGTLRGRVLSVSDYPMTAEGMLSVLENQQLVSSFMAEGPPYEARVALVPSSTSFSHYAWSNGSGPPVLLSSGTTASAEITVRRQAPIRFLLPASRSSGASDPR